MYVKLFFEVNEEWSISQNCKFLCWKWTVLAILFPKVTRIFSCVKPRTIDEAIHEPWPHFGVRRVLFLYELKGQEVTSAGDSRGALWVLNCIDLYFKV